MECPRSVALTVGAHGGRHERLLVMGSLRELRVSRGPLDDGVDAAVDADVDAGCRREGLVWAKLDNMDPRSDGLRLAAACGTRDARRAATPRQ